MVKENAPDRLLVEGSDDKWSIINLMMKHGCDWGDKNVRSPYVHSCGGIRKLIDSLEVAVKTYERLGIIVDANANISGRWNEVKSSLHRAGVSVPDTPEEKGLISSGMYSDWKVGIWLMPDNHQSGALEDFLSTLVPSDDPCWDYAGQAADKAKELGAEFMETDKLKAKIHTWLSWQKEPGLPFGTAITAAYFKHDSPTALAFVDWFNRLFLQ